MISNLSLLFFALAKAALLTGIGPAVLLVILYEYCGVRIVRVGFEKVSGSGQLAERNELLAVAEFPNHATSPARNQKARCA